MVTFIENRYSESSKTSEIKNKNVFFVKRFFFSDDAAAESGFCRKKVSDPGDPYEKNVGDPGDPKTKIRW